MEKGVTHLFKVISTRDNGYRVTCMVKVNILLLMVIRM